MRLNVYQGAAVLVLLALSLAVQAKPATVDDYEMSAQEIAPNVYAVLTPSRDFPSAENLGWNANMAFVVTEEGVLVFDTGSSEVIGEAILRTIRTVTEAPIRWIVNSHSHGDHWLGNAAVAEDGTEILASARTRELIENDGLEWVRRFNDMTEGATGDSRVLPPNVTVSDNSARDFGGVRGEFYLSPHGHSPGDLVLWLPEQRVLLAGDVVYQGRIAGTFDADFQGWIALLEVLEALGAEVVVPGHGDVTEGEAVARQRAYFERLWAVVEEGFDEGLPDFEIAPRVREQMAEFETYYPDLQEGIGASVSHAYLQVEAAAF
ncbi:MBL fold metallo-hydrolase [Ectothiorhodospiraceae bacterium 2226]|nr:MBL fold metallo-hydrolase [Ectothiorhodospiraceae bacterium 2226]